MSKQWNFEILSWLFIIVFSVLIVGPIYIKAGNSFNFYYHNILSVVIFLGLTRYIFLLKYTPISRIKWVKMLFVFLPIPFVLFQIDSLYEFQRFIDEEGTISLFKGSTDIDDYQFGKYIRLEFVFFCVASLVSLFALPVRMIISFWRTTNTKDLV